MKLVVRVLIIARSEVRFRGHSGNHLLVLSFTGFDPDSDIGLAVVVKTL
jgi:hypothetical protein